MDIRVANCVEWISVMYLIEWQVVGTRDPRRYVELESVHVVMHEVTWLPLFMECAMVY